MAGRSPAEKLLTSLPKIPRVPGVPGSGRQPRYSASTKRTLVEVATALFTAQGYAGTSLDAIAAGAKVTKGALYHHFSGKRAVFEAVFDQIEGEADRTIARALRTPDPWGKAIGGLRAYLQVAQDPGYQRVVIQDGPGVLGYERFRDQEDRSSYALVEDIVGSVLATLPQDLDEGMVSVFSQLLFGAMAAGGETVSRSSDPLLAVARVETAISYLLAGLRALADQGVAIPDPRALLVDDDPTERLRAVGAEPDDDAEPPA